MSFSSCTFVVSYLCIGLFTSFEFFVLLVGLMKHCGIIFMIFWRIGACD